MAPQIAPVAPHAPDDFGTTAAASSSPLSDEVQRVLHPAFRLPPWLLGLLRDKASGVEIGARLQESLLNKEADLHDVQYILNSIGGQRGGATVLKRFVTQETINRLSEGT